LAWPGIVASVLDLAPIVSGGTAAVALRNSLELCRHVERLGYHRFWVAEHHGIAGVASAATSVVIGFLAGGTSTIRVGAGGIMLPNHSPLVIAEQFGTLESLYPGRIDLGLGRAPGGDARAMHALRTTAERGATFPQDVLELQALLGPVRPDQAVRAVPGQGLDVPLYILGSSTFGARLAADLGLPYAFASHFAPKHLHEAIGLYRAHFRPSPTFVRPHVMVTVNVFAADTDHEAERLFTSLLQVFLGMVRGQRGQLSPPVDHIDWSEFEQVYVQQMVRYSAVGGPERLRRELQAIVDETAADEIIATSQMHDQAARLRSFEIAADAFRALSPAGSR